MKLLFENWRKYLNEQNEPKVITFDFDDTLSLSNFETVPDQPDPDLEDWVHHGPNQEMINLLMDHHKNGAIIYIVTSRHKELQDEEGRWFRDMPNTDPPRKYFEEFQMPVWKFVKIHGLPVQDVIFTNGEVKAKAENGLVKLRAAVHHDDDPEEIAAAEAAGIKAVVSDPYGDYKDLEASELKMQKQTPEELEEVGMNPMVSLNMQPNGKKEAEDEI